MRRHMTTRRAIQWLADGFLSVVARRRHFRSGAPLVRTYVRVFIKSCTIKNSLTLTTQGRSQQHVAPKGHAGHEHWENSCAGSRVHGGVCGVRSLRARGGGTASASQPAHAAGHKSSSPAVLQCDASPHKWRGRSWIVEVPDEHARMHRYFQYVSFGRSVQQHVLFAMGFRFDFSAYRNLSVGSVQASSFLNM